MKRVFLKDTETLPEGATRYQHKVFLTRKLEVEQQGYALVISKHKVLEDDDFEEVWEHFEDSNDLDDDPGSEDHRDHEEEVEKTEIFVERCARTIDMFTGKAEGRAK